MATPEPALRSIREPHIHALGETCPMCDQPIPNDKAEEVRARMEAQERSAALVANTRANQQIAAEKAQIEAVAGAKFEELRKEKEEALEKAAADAAARAEGLDGCHYSGRACFGNVSVRIGNRTQHVAHRCGRNLCTGNLCC